MILTRYQTHGGPNWRLDDLPLPEGLTLSVLLRMHRQDMMAILGSLAEGAGAAPPTISASNLENRAELGLDSKILSPAEPDQEVWASGVTYLRSRNERQAESAASEVYTRVYDAERPEIFFKSIGWRTVGHGGMIRIRRDSAWNVPEPELTLVINRYAEIVGYTAGNDVSSRSIEGENPLYLPQAKSYDGSCALGPSIVLADPQEMTDLPIQCTVSRNGEEVFAGDARTSHMKRRLETLVEFLTRELSFPKGVFLMTGTGIVPNAEFTLQPGDIVHVKVAELTLTNGVHG